MRYHQMGYEMERRQARDGFDDHRAEGEVRHKLPVHHIEMEQIGACFLDGVYFLRQFRKIGR
jgi:hypothetical protein